jgi:cyclic pyranopterin phosphate synthase
MPEYGVPLQSHQSILRYEEIARLVTIAASLGISKVRLTGGEPLARIGLEDLVRLLARIPGIDDLSMTTNGTLLAAHAEPLAEAGLHRVNVSLDTLRPDRFLAITRRGRLEDVLAGMDAARAAGLIPVKINMVVVRGLNDDEVLDFARRTQTHGWHVRFIEIMPLGEGRLWSGDGYVSVAEMRSRIEEEVGPLQGAHLGGNGPARYWQLPGAEGTIGFISPVSEHFCFKCNRLRLTADGRLLPCLLSQIEIDLRTPLRQGLDDVALRSLFLDAVARKPAGHELAEHLYPQRRLMSRTGG